MVRKPLLQSVYNAIEPNLQNGSCSRDFVHLCRGGVCDFVGVGLASLGVVYEVNKSFARGHLHSSPHKYIVAVILNH